VRVAIVHDYLTQRGGAERVVLSMARAFPGAPIHTSLYDPAGTFPEFAELDVRPMPLNRVGALRRNHRLAVGLLARAFSQLEVDADVVLCSSSGWAHGVRATGRKVVYCYTPARWLYQPERYLREQPGAARLAMEALRPGLLRWDGAAAADAARYLTSSTAVRERIREVYGRDADVLPPPPTIDADGEQSAVGGLQERFFLCVSRLLPYKNVDAIMEAFADLPDRRLVVVGEGPDRARLRELRPANVLMLGQVLDSELRWLYSRCTGLVSAAHEDYGLTPLEAAAFGKPSAVLRWGGFVDTVAEGRTGLFFAEPRAEAIAGAVRELLDRSWEAAAIRAHAAGYSEERFVERLRAIVEEEAGMGRPAEVAAR
jgi:glycosyltransferase involved in cell wall biosynthesis